MSDSSTPVGAATVEAARYRFHLFAVLWAVAALFHIAGNHPAPWVPITPELLVSRAAVVAAACMVFVPQLRTVALFALCLAVTINAWLEAPVVGNHWVLAAVISLAFAAAFAGRRGNADAAFSVFAPTARLCFAIAYAFAGFAKLNSGFFDPSVSCAVYYQDQLVSSWGLPVLSVAGRPELGLAAAVGAAVVELAVAASLFVPRLRRPGLVLALSFHWLLALDWNQHFWDFSSVLFAGFPLFGGDELIHRLRDGAKTVGARVPIPIRLLGAAVAVVAVVGTAAVAVAPSSPVFRGVAAILGHAMWVLVATPVVVATTIAVIRSTRTPARPMLRVPLVWALLPALVFFNGLTPYLEIKTGFGWNMYANLRTVAGESNHFVIPRTIDLTGLQRDRVEILDASNSNLERVADQDYEIVFSEFHEYAREHPDDAVTYRYRGQTVTADRIGDEAAFRAPISLISSKLQSFRAVDASGQERCQQLFTPAR